MVLEPGSLVEGNPGLEDEGGVFIDAGGSKVEVAHKADGLVKVFQDEARNLVLRRTLAGLAKDFHIVRKAFLDDGVVSVAGELGVIVVSTQEVGLSYVVLDGFLVAGDLSLFEFGNDLLQDIVDIVKGGETPVAAGVRHLPHTVEELVVHSGIHLVVSVHVISQITVSSGVAGKDVGILPNEGGIDLGV